MKVEYVEEGSSLRHLDIELPPEALAEEFERGVSSLRQKVKLPGFRKGKTPKEVIRKRFHDDVMNQAVQDLLPEALGKAIKEKNLNPLNDPRISNLEPELGKPLRFRASFEVLPELDVQGYKGLTATRRNTEVTDEQIDKAIDKLRESHARFDPIEGRGAEDRDFVMGHLTEVQQGQAAGSEPRKHEGVTIEVGSDAYHAKLHETLQGAEPGQTMSFVASFPEDHTDPNRAGKSFDASFELVELKEKVLPAADDELAKDAGEFDTLDELRAKLRERGEAEAKQQDEQDLRNQLLRNLLEVNPFEPPETLVESEVDGRLEEAARNLIQQGVDPRQAGVDWQALRQEQRASAIDSVKATILLDRIAALEELAVTDEEMEPELEKASEALNKNVAALRAQMIKEGSFERLRRRLLREKAVDFIKQHAKLK